MTGGAFFRNYDVAGDGDKTVPATVSSFRLDKYEVTVGRYRAFLDANRGTQANPPDVGSGANSFIAGSGWQASWNQSLPASRSDAVQGMKTCGGTPIFTWTDAPGPNEDLPINCITWYEALAFCAWDGGFLPTDSELNYASASGNEQRVYPWSSPPSSTLLDAQHANYGCSPCTVASIHKVGMSPAGDGKYGQSDLSGNIEEWALDENTFGAGNCFKNGTSDCADIDPVGPSSERLLRSGYFGSDSDRLRTTYSQGYGATARTIYHGVRCGRAL